MKGFLFGVGQMVSMTAGNYLRRFPIRCEKSGIHSDRKLFAKGFLHGMGRVVYIVTGNYLQRVSYPMWDECKS
jgi:hypothetical protein